MSHPRPPPPKVHTIKNKNRQIKIIMIHHSTRRQNVTLGDRYILGEEEGSNKFPIQHLLRFPFLGRKMCMLLIDRDCHTQTGK